MKYMLSLAACLLFIAGYSQTDTLFLRVNALTTGKPLLQFNKGLPIDGEGTIAPASASWVLKITSVAGTKVTISHTEGDAASVTLPGNNATYIIANNKLEQPPFTLGRIFKISVVNAGSAQTIRSFDVTLNTAMVREADGRVDEAAVINYKPGSVIHDALYLANGSNIVYKKKILAYYSLATDSATQRASFAANPFLDSIARDLLGKNGQQSTLSLASVFSSIGGLDVTALADGAAKFIVKRAKQELSLAFFQKLKNVIDGTPDLGTVFPQTANLLNAMGDEVYDYEKYIQNLREGFKQDLREVHRNLPGIIDNHPAFFNAHQPAKAGLLTACYLAQELDNGSHPGDILAAYPVQYLDSIADKNYSGALQTVQLLSASLRDTATAKNSGYWVGIKIIRELVNDKAAFKIYLGLLLQEAHLRYGDISFNGTTLVDLLRKVAVEYNSRFAIYTTYRNYVLRFGEKVEALNELINAAGKEAITDSARVEKYAKYFRASVDLMAYSTQAFRLPVLRDETGFAAFPLLLNNYFEIAYTATNLVADITRKNYSAVINDAVRIYNLVTIKAAEEPALSVATISLSIDSAGRANYKKGFQQTATKLVRYGSFMATIATAKNSDEVERAIEAAALPVGSSRVKRVSDFNVSLNAYAGLFYGAERINGVDSKGLQANVYGVTAPIGVAASWGHRFLVFPTGRSEWSTSLFFSLIDLGAVAAFRFTNDSTEQVPTIRLKNIFSPGAFLSIGIPKTPLSVNVGAQVGPNLRNVSAAANDFSNNVYWRFSTSVVVDIPLFNFHTSSK